MRTCFFPACALLAMLLGASSALACIDQHGSPSHDTDSIPMRGHTEQMMDKTANPATQAFMAANHKMHQDMAIAYSGDADTDFVRGMIPHHQGAIDMAKVVLDHGKDPELRQLAQDIITAQTKEIAMMQDWLKQHDTTAVQTKE